MPYIKISGSFNKGRPKCVCFYYFYFKTLSVILLNSNKRKLVLLAIYQSKYLLGSLKNQELIFNADKLPIMKHCFWIFITHPLIMAGFVKFASTLLQALGFNLSLKKLVDLVTIQVKE